MVQPSQTSSRWNPNLHCMSKIEILRTWQLEWQTWAMTKCSIECSIYTIEQAGIQSFEICVSLSRASCRHRSRCDADKWHARIPAPAETILGPVSHLRVE